MTLLARLSHKMTPVVAINIPLEFWYHLARTQPMQSVQKVEMCTALTGQEALGEPVGKTHRHTLLRVFLSPKHGDPGALANAFFIERVLSAGGSYHSVTPMEETLLTGSTPFHPNIHDRICVVSEGPSTTLEHHLVVERTLTFGDGLSAPHLTLAQLSRILDLVSRTTTFICVRGDCTFHSRSFAFACMAALAPTLPPPTLAGKPGAVQRGVDETADFKFAMGAKMILDEVPWLMTDPESEQAWEYIRALKDEPLERERERLVVH